MTSLTVRKATAVFRKDLALALAYRANFVRGFVAIGVQVVTFYFISKLVGPSSLFGVDGRPVPYFDYVAVNLAFMRFQGTAIDSFQRAVRGDQMMGTVEAVLATPTSLPLLVLASGLYAFAMTFVQIALFFAVAIPLGLDLSHIDLATTAIFLALTVAAMSPVGVLGAASIVAFKQEPPTSALVGGVATLFGGVLFPIAKLPLPLQAVSWLLPISHSLGGLRAAVGGAGLWTTRGDAMWLAIMAVVCFPLSLVVFTAAVRRAKRDGTLGDY
ncbi:MAG: hypothetical protein NVSMB59_15660 [Vulcanimicrobiaceae bacterium]